MSGNAQQFNGREFGAATFLSRRLFTFNLRGCRPEPRHLNRYMLLGYMKLFLLIITLILFSNICLAQKSQNKCHDWQVRIAPNTSFYFRNDDDKTQEEIYEGIECLLKLKGKKYGSNVSGATRGDVSQLFFEPTSVEVAALYYITYLVYQKWDYADAPYLVNKKGKLNTSKSVAKAYKAYRVWLEKIKDIGLEEARKQEVNPLECLRVSWY